jgi:hypothetical protein
MRLLLAGLLSVMLAACEADVTTAYKPDPGDYPVVVESLVQLAYPALDKNLFLRVTFPEPEGQYPVIIFSHGGRCSRDLYVDLADHWASHGYIVIQPAHLDSVSIEKPSLPRGVMLMKEASRTRPLDVIWIADSLGRIEELVPGLAGKIDAERLVAAGHSLGGGTAMTVTGLTLIDPNDDTLGDVVDERFDLLLLITNPGNNPMMPEDPWRVVAVPTFVATGTKDYSALAKRMKRGSGFRFPDDVSFADTPNHFLMIQDMDHYLGGLICRNDVDGPPDHDAVDIINGVSVAFLNAYLRDDPTAMEFLEGATVPGLTGNRGELDIR